MTEAVLLFLLGLALLILGGNWFVDGAVDVSRKFHVPELIIGATVVSVGTTLPEVLVSAESALSGHSGIAYGNAIGSIICNTALIAAIVAVLKPSKIKRSEISLPLLFFFIAAGIYVANAYITGYFSRAFGIVLLLVFAVYILLSVRKIKKDPAPLPDAEENKEHEKKKARPFWLSIVLLVLGAAGIAFGARLLVDNGTVIATELGVPESVIALTFVALGTSLPELVTAITSIAKGHGALSLGNIIGANLFNIVLVSGISCTLSEFQIPAAKTVFGHNASLIVDTPVMLLVMVLLALPAFCRKKLSRGQGIILLLIYAAFCVFQFAV